MGQYFTDDAGARCLLDFGRFSERLSVIANVEQHEYLESPLDSLRMKRRAIP
jgi:hypothetical protein